MEVTQKGSQLYILYTLSFQFHVTKQHSLHNTGGGKSMVPIIHMNTLNPDPKVCAVQPSVWALARYWVGLGRGPRPAPAQRYAACACKNELRSEKSDKLNFSTCLNIQRTMDQN